ncbi:MAG: FliA/WhiG family RNA polymerase sigma factor [Clostridium sp.]
MKMRELEKEEEYVCLEEKCINKNRVEEYIPLVKYIAGRIAIEKNRNIEYEDLIGYGILGLIDAISKYDENRGTKFSSYASLRIRGTIIDELRKNRPISKNAMNKLKKYNMGLEFLRNELLREPMIKEVMEYLGFKIDDIIKIEGYRNIIGTISLDFMLREKDNTKAIINIIEDKSVKTPEDIYIDFEIKKILKESLNELKEKDRIVLKFYYYDELTLKKIGEILNVSESRVCQIHSRALKNLKVVLNKKLDRE